MTRCAVCCVSAAISFVEFYSVAFAAEGQKINVGFQVPASNYQVKIQEVHQVGDEVWVVSKVTGGGGFGLQVISQAGDEITLKEEVDGMVIHKVLGKSWNWGKDTETLHYVADAKSLAEELKKKDAKLIWKRRKPKAE